MATGYLRRVSANGNGGRIRLTPKAFDKTHRGEGNGYPVNGHLVCILAGVSGTLEDCWDLAGILSQVRLARWATPGGLDVEHSRADVFQYWLLTCVALESFEVLYKVGTNRHC